MPPWKKAHFLQPFIVSKWVLHQIWWCCKYLEVVREFLSACIPRVHGDEHGTGGVQCQLCTLKHKPATHRHNLHYLFILPTMSSTVGILYCCCICLQGNCCQWYALMQTYWLLQIHLFHNLIIIKPQANAWNIITYHEWSNLSEQIWLQYCWNY